MATTRRWVRYDRFPNFGVGAPLFWSGKWYIGNTAGRAIVLVGETVHRQHRAGPRAICQALHFRKTRDTWGGATSPAVPRSCVTAIGVSARSYGTAGPSAHPYG